MNNFQVISFYQKVNMVKIGKFRVLDTLREGNHIVPSVIKGKQKKGQLLFNLRYM